MTTRLALVVALGLSTFLGGCASTVVGTGSATEEVNEASKDPAAEATEETDADDGREQEIEEGSATLYVDSVPFPAFDSGSARRGRNGVIKVTLGAKDRSSADPKILLDVTAATIGCVQRGSTAPHSLTWRPQGDVGGSAQYMSSYGPDCGLFVDRVDAEVGGRVQGRFVGYVTLAYGRDPDVATSVLLDLTFDVPLTK
ncbi:MAG: hypothetical protein KIS78_00505 [Labilithrix sp.]|nr:hypothetical protein [Labilithrix sp.]MCW5830918.1 hypothetical protein [Labilithrix sp.]